jgi:hypothetical protein
VTVRCKSFVVPASENVDLRAGADLVAEAATMELFAREGGLRARANDDVQLLGERILLNCDRQPTMPEWVQLPLPESLPLGPVSGDPALIAHIKAASPT